VERNDEEAIDEIKLPNDLKTGLRRGREAATYVKDVIAVYRKENAYSKSELGSHRILPISDYSDYPT
jgi:hypothetical protein